METANRHHANKPSAMNANDRAKMRGAWPQAKRAPRLSIPGALFILSGIVPLIFMGGF
jgi:hypothetical protein